VYWENSWKISTGPSNWDAVWIFVKRQNCNTVTNNQWVHQMINPTGNSVTTTNSPITVDAVTDSMGVFLRRINSGVGTISTQTVVLQLPGSSIATNTHPYGITTGATDNFRIYGLEMVYVPQGSFYAGDGRPTNSSNFNAGSGTPVLITAQTQSNGIGAFSNYVSSPTYGCPSPLPASFPIGYNGFYCMKYELTQQNICDWLNTLSYTQQASSMAYWGSRLPNVVNNYWSWTETYEQIYVATAGTYATIPAIFTAPYGFKSTFSLDWSTLTSYLSWSGLRPMTEFEFEKSCRGNNGGGATGTPNNPVPYEYPWGNTLISENGLSNQGQSSEYVNSIADGWVNWSWNWPTRGGAAALANTNRSQSGSTYYGIMDMGGNAYEQCIGGGSGYDYSGFTTANGNALLNPSTAAANITGWPTVGGPSSGTVVRGGNSWSNSCSNPPYRCNTSDRQGYNGTVCGNDDNRYRNGTGGRGIRTF